MYHIYRTVHIKCFATGACESKQIYEGARRNAVIPSSYSTFICSYSHITIHACKPLAPRLIYSRRPESDTGVTSHPLPEREKITLQRISHLRLQC